MARLENVALRVGLRGVGDRTAKVVNAFYAARIAGEQVDVQGPISL
ncbi:MAG: hypothetical protein M3295_02100 [Chloroflexota bacterium]|nr:hypothetical protein [Chloroflexota bacterium]